MQNSTLTYIVGGLITAAIIILIVTSVKHKSELKADLVCINGIEHYMITGYHRLAVTPRFNKEGVIECESQ